MNERSCGIQSQWNIFGHKNEEILTLETTQIDLEGILLSEISQTVREKYCMTSFLYDIKKKKAHRKRELIFGYQS